MLIEQEPKDIVEHPSYCESIILDVREAWEIEICALGNTINIPLNKLKERFKELPINQTIYTLCHHGMRSAQAAHFLMSQQFNNVINIKGGIALWAQQVDPRLKKY